MLAQIDPRKKRVVSPQLYLHASNQILSILNSINFYSQLFFDVFMTEVPII